MKQFIYHIRKANLAALNLSYFALVEEVLTSMIFFITETESKDPYTCEGIPNKKRQRYIRELNVIELLVDILHYPFAEHLYNEVEITSKTPITRIC